jgi:hypothetical protein
MPQDIFDFWSQIRRGEKIHPADKHVFRRMNPERHGFQLECLPACFAGPLRTAQVVLLYLSPGFDEAEIARAKTKECRDLYFRRWKGNEPLSDSSTSWFKSRTRNFGDWENVRHKVAILNIGAYHSKTFNDYSVLAALPSSRVSLEWAQNKLFPEAEAGKRIVICMRSASYWGLEQGKSYRGSLFAPLVNRSGHLIRDDKRERLIELVRERLSN